MEDIIDNDLLPTEEDLNDEAVANFYEAFHQSFEQAKKKSPFGDFLFKELVNGNKTIYNKSVRETKVFDNSFVQVLEAAYPSFQKISRDPKKAIKYDNEVVQMEKAKKFDSDSVRHLASHTQFIKEVKNDGMVIPSKVLTTFSDEDLGIYENRFYKTLTNRIIKFLEDRLKVLQTNLDSYQSDVVQYTNEFKTEGRTINLDCKVKVSKDLKEEMSTAQAVLNKVDRLCELYRGLRNSPFMQAIKNTKDVSSPIMKTNIILHNPDFKILYTTWTFMEGYNNMAYDVELKEQNYPDDVDVLSDIQNITTVMVADLLYHRGVNGADLSLNRRKFKRASQVKEVTKNEDEYHFKPEAVKMENYQMSELMLSETADMYQESLERHEADGMTRDMSIKAVVREMLNMINNIYPRAFKAEYSELDTPTYKEQLEAEKYKQKVIKLVREQKQIDLNKMLRDEEKCNKKILSLEKKAKAEELRRIKEEKMQEERRKREAAKNALKEKREALRKAREDEELQKLRKEQALAEEERKKEEEKLRLEAEEEFKNEYFADEIKEEEKEIEDPNAADSILSSLKKVKENRMSPEEKKKALLEALKKSNEKYADPNQDDSLASILNKQEEETKEAEKERKLREKEELKNAYNDPDKEDSLKNLLKK